MARPPPAALAIDDEKNVDATLAVCLEGLAGLATIQLSAGTGMDTDQVGDALAQVLPDLVNQLTPEGQVPENHQELVSEGLTALFPASLPDR